MEIIIVAGPIVVARHVPYGGPRWDQTRAFQKFLQFHVLAYWAEHIHQSEIGTQIIQFCKVRQWDYIILVYQSERVVIAQKGGFHTTTNYLFELSGTQL